MLNIKNGFITYATFVSENYYGVAETNIRRGSLSVDTVTSGMFVAGSWNSLRLNGV